MYYKSLSDRPEKNYTLYIVHKANIIAYSDLQNSLRFMENRKIPVQNMADKEQHFVKAIVNGILWNLAQIYL